MKDCIIKIIFLFIILTGLNVSAQTETTDLCKEIYGKWKTYYIQLPFGSDPKDKSETWIFTEDRTLTIDGKITSYVLEDNCSKLFIGDSPKFFSVVMLKDTLYMGKNIFPHESYVLRFKKIN